MKGKYRLLYTVDKIVDELYVEVELKPIEGTKQPKQNVYYGIARVNGALRLNTDLMFCVDAVFAAEEIGLEEKENLKKKYRAEGRSFRVKKEEIS